MIVDNNIIDLLYTAFIIHFTLLTIYYISLIL